MKVLKSWEFWKALWGFIHATAVLLVFLQACYLVFIKDYTFATCLFSILILTKLTQMFDWMKDQVEVQ